MRLDTAPEIIDMASALGIPSSAHPVSGIIRHCVDKIANWVKEAGGARTFQDVERIACQKLSLVFEEVHSDSDLDAIIAKYVAMGELGFASLKYQLDEKTFASLMERKRIKKGAKDRYVAIIDCRGAKGQRRFFTRWHEMAHLLTLVGQLELFHRSEDDEHPIEKLMDTIAGEIGFYGPVFEPVLLTEIEEHGPISFQGVQRIRDAVCPSASFQATLIASIKRCPSPIILLEVGMGYKKEESSRLRSRQIQMFAAIPPKAKLRALRAVANATAKEQCFSIHPNMQVPISSIVALHFEASADLESSTGAAGVENLSIWRHSDGVPLGQGEIHVEARKIAGTMYAIARQLGYGAYQASVRAPQSMKSN